MFSLEGYTAIDLSPRIVPRIKRTNGSIEEGELDPYGRPWVMWEGRFPGDNSLFTIYAAPKGDGVLKQERMSSHNGSHVQGGKGHISHWAGVSEDIKGLWELDLETFLGEAAVCNLAHQEPRALAESEQYPKGEGYRTKSLPGDVRGQEILPDHLDNIQRGDIVLMTSPFKGLDQPWLSARTVNWLINDRKIKMLGCSYPGIEWQYDLKVAAPDNSPVRRMLLGADIPIVHPLVNLDTLTSDRVFYVGMPLHIPHLEASFVRSVAFQPEESLR